MECTSHTVTKRVALFLCRFVHITLFLFILPRIETHECVCVWDEKCELSIVIGKSTRSTRTALKMQHDYMYFMVTSTCNRSLCKRRRAESWEKTRTNEFNGFFLLLYIHTDTLSMTPFRIPCVHWSYQFRRKKI